MKEFIQEVKENELNFDEVEGYIFCDTKKEKCLNDCTYPDYGPRASQLT